MSNRSDDNSNNKENKINHEMKLTPWQEANRDYLRAHPEKKIKLPNNEKSNYSEADDTVEALDENEALLSVDEGVQEAADETTERTRGFPSIKDPDNHQLYRRLFSIIFIFSLPIFFLIYYISPLSKLQEIQVTGNSVVDSATIKNGLSATIGENIWQQYGQREQFIANLKKKEPRVKSASITLNHFNQFSVKISEYPEVALVSKNGQYYPVLENGRVLADAIENPTKNLPILEEFNDESLIVQLLEQYNQLSDELKKAISEIKHTPRANNNYLLNLYMNDGNQVIVNITNLASQMRFYPQVAADMAEPGIIDMEVGIFSQTNPKNSNETNESETVTE